jgi:hypothetical protein
MIKPIDYSAPFVIGTTLAPWKCDRNEHLDWIADAEKIQSVFPNVKFFASLEVDNRGLLPYRDVLVELGKVSGEYWTFSINDNRRKVTSQNRWIRIETGRNLIREFAQTDTWPEDGKLELLGPIVKYNSILYVDSDIKLTLDTIKRMMQIDSYVVGVDIPAYKLQGKASIALLLVNSPAYYDLPFYHNKYEMINDDKKFMKVVEEKYGIPYVINDIDLGIPIEYVDVEARQIPDRLI